MRTHDLTDQGTHNALRYKSPKGITIHTPSTTFVRRVIDRAGDAGDPITSEFDLDEECALDFDERRYQGGIFIGYTGDRWLLQDDKRRAQHSGMLARAHPEGQVYADPDEWPQWALPLGNRRWQKHHRDPARVYDYWYEVYSPLGYTSPIQFPFGRFPNRYIGIDLRPGPDGEFSAACLDTLKDTVVELSQKHDFEIDATRVITHALADPLGRGTISRKGKVIGVPWDPSKTWDHIAFIKDLQRRD